MATWQEFSAAAPELALAAEERFEKTGLVLVGTLRRDGWPRISPVEPLLFEGRLYLGMMWQSKKALDLQRDSRCIVHNTVCDKSGVEGEVKISGRAHEVNDPGERERYCQALEAKIGWRPENDEFHLFSVEIDRAGYIRFADDKQVSRHWREGEPVSEPLVRMP
jgi:hypothetical protein